MVTVTKQLKKRPNIKSNFIIFLFVIILTIGMVFLPAASRSQTFNVSTIGDFRLAIFTAQSNGQDDTIVVAPGTINIGSSPVRYAPMENFSLIIEGDSAATTILDGGNTAGILDIDTFSSTSPVTIRDMTFQNGNYVIGVYVGALRVATTSAITVERCVFTENGGDGGAVSISVFSGGTATVINNIFSGNKTTSGMGTLQLETIGGTGTLTNNTFAGNRSSFGGPGGVGFNASLSGDVINIYNNIVWGADNAEGRIEGFDVTGTTVNLFNNTYRELNYTPIGSLSQGSNNSVNPQFLDAGSWDNNGTPGDPSDDLWTDGNYHLQAGSPARDSGSNSAPGLPSSDFDGNPRIINTTVDRGAYEYITPPDISVTDSAGDPSDLQVPFGNVTENTTSDQTVTVSNLAGGNLIIGTLGSLSVPFSIETDNCSGKTLALSQSCTIMVRFSPTSLASFSDSFDIPSNDPDENPVTVSVSGTGTTLLVPDITVTDSVAPASDLQVPFGSITQFTTSDQTVTVGNTGTALLNIGLVASADALAPPFSIESENCTNHVLTTSPPCTITVRFSPVTIGAFSDTFDIPSDDPDENPVTVSVSGTGVLAAPDITVTDSVPPDNDLQVQFGTNVIGSSTEHTVTVGNNGTDLLDIFTVGQSDSLTTPFSITAEDCSGKSLAPSETCTITVRFNSNDQGPFSDSFDITCDDPDENPVTVNVTGTASTGVSAPSFGKSGGCVTIIPGDGRSGGYGTFWMLISIGLIWGKRKILKKGR